MKLTFKEVKQQCKYLDMTLTKRDDEYRISYGSESTACYEYTLDAALDTAKAMYRFNNPGNDRFIIKYVLDLMPHNITVMCTSYNEMKSEINSMIDNGDIIISVENISMHHYQRSERHITTNQ